MNELALANIVTTLGVIILAVLALIVGYTTGYKDAVRHMEKRNKE